MTMTLSTTDIAQSAAQELIFFPASFAQESLWFIDQLSPGMATYNIPSALRVRGELKIELLERTVKEIVRRHETLRTRFVAVRGEPQQVIEDQVSVQLPLLDLTCVDEGEREAEAIRLAREEARQPFDLQQAPLIRVKALRLRVQEHVLLFTMHHIIADAWSAGVLVEEVSVLYSAFCAGQPSPLPELPIQYADYTMWQREWLQGQVLEQQLSYWKQQLAGSSLLQMPTDRPRPPLQSQNGAVFDFAIAANLTQQLKRLAEENGATLFMFVVAAFQTLLYRYSGQNDIAVGTPIAGRRRSETEKLIGFFLNTLVLRGDLSGAPTFSELLQRTKEITLEAYAYQDVPFEKLVEVLSPERDLGSTPLFQVMITLQNAPQSDLHLGTATFQPFSNVDNGTSKFDLLLQLSEDGGGVLTGLLQYSTDLFENVSIKRMADHYCTLLCGIVADPHRSIAALPLLTVNERDRLIEEWNHTEGVYAPQSVQELFEAQTAKSPGSMAVEFGDQRLTYAELDSRSNQLARYLNQNGVGLDVCVGICIQRSLDMVVSVLAVLKAGAAYVPLDPQYPHSRLAYMLEDSKVELLLTQEQLLNTFSGLVKSTFCLDANWHEVVQQSPRKLKVNTDATSLAYVMYTSGSTGKPKGVAMVHGALANLVNWQLSNGGNGKALRTLQFTSLSFDVSFQEIFSTWCGGGSLILVDEDTRRDPSLLWRVIHEQQVERVFVPFVALQQLAEVSELPADETTALREVITAGEQLKITPALQRFFDHSSRILENQYGPTESHVVTAYRLNTPSSQWPLLPPIGKAIANTQVYVLDEMFEPTPVGVVGQIYLGGAGLARGYVNRPDWTAERFVPSPCSKEPGARLYRTGDLARYRADGNLEFLGRMDHQVKVRGYRIELGEIEAALEAEDRVRQAVVILREDTPSDNRLVAYVVPNHEITVIELRDALKLRVPEYMVPSNFVMMEALPLTPSGKLNRAALPIPVSGPTKQDPGFNTRRSRATLEELLAQIWADVLRLDRVGVQDDFFALGGHSLLATQAVARIRSVFHIDLPLRRLFEEPTVAGLAKVIEQQIQQGLMEKTPSLVRVPRDRPLPLSYGQQRLWFVHELAPDSAAYNVAGATRITGPLDVELFNRTMTEMFRRHESFRTRFVTVDQEPLQIIDEATKFELLVIDMTALPPEERVEETRRQARKESQRPFDLARDPMLRVRAWRLADNDYVAHINMYHIATDAWSLGVLMREFSLVYEAFGKGKPSPLPEMPIQYADFSVWQREWLRGEVLDQQLAYWKRQLANGTTLELPTDRARSARGSSRGVSAPLNLSKDLTDKIKALGRRHGATLYMTLLAAFQLLLYRWSGQHDITLGSPIAGRRRTETEGMIGFFVNLLVMRTDLSGAPTFVQLLRRVREVAMEAYTHQDVSFEKLVEALSPERDPSHPPFFQVLFFLQNAPVTDLSLGEEIKLEPFAAGTAAVKFDITIVLQETADGMQGSSQYNADLYDAGTMAALVEQYRTLLANIGDNPELSIDDYSLLPEVVYKQLIENWNQRLDQEERAGVAAVSM